MKKFLRRKLFIRALALPRRQRLAVRASTLLLATTLVFLPAALKIARAAGLEAVANAVCLLEFGARPVFQAVSTPAATPPQKTPVPTAKPTPTVKPAAVPSPKPAVPPLSSDSVAIKGDTAGINVAALLNEPLTLGKGARILILHTHSTESYLYDGSYAETSEAHTLDEKHNVVRVGDELQRELESRGFSVIHDRGRYDYPSYAGAYSRSLVSAEDYIKKYPDVGVIIDLHRDAITDSEGKIYKTARSANGESASQLMLVVGMGSAELQNPHWRENLKLAVRLQAALNAQRPELARPISLTAERYNQQLSPGALLVEVGSSGDTLEEALAAVRAFASAVARILGSV